MNKFEDLKGKTLAAVSGRVGGHEVVFTTTEGEMAKLYHSQDCCESVSVEDICGDFDDIIGSPLLLAEEATSKENPAGIIVSEQDSFTWTFYKLDTVKGGVTIRWYGESNGYYSESVDFAQIKTPTARGEI